MGQSSKPRGGCSECCEGQPKRNTTNQKSLTPLTAGECQIRIYKLPGQTMFYGHRFDLRCNLWFRTKCRNFCSLVREWSSLSGGVGGKGRKGRKEIVTRVPSFSWLAWAVLSPSRQGVIKFPPSICRRSPERRRRRSRDGGSASTKHNTCMIIIISHFKFPSLVIALAAWLEKKSVRLSGCPGQ